MKVAESLFTVDSFIGAAQEPILLHKNNFLCCLNKADNRLPLGFTTTVNFLIASGKGIYFSMNSASI